MYIESAYLALAVVILLLQFLLFLLRLLNYALEALVPLKEVTYHKPRPDNPLRAI